MSDNSVLVIEVLSGLQIEFSTSLISRSPEGSTERKFNELE